MLTPLRQRATTAIRGPGQLIVPKWPPAMTYLITVGETDTYYGYSSVMGSIADQFVPFERDMVGLTHILFSKADPTYSISERVYDVDNGGWQYRGAMRCRIELQGLGSAVYLFNNVRGYAARWEWANSIADFVGRQVRFNYWPMAE